MELDTTFYGELAAVNWFITCGNGALSLDTVAPVTWLSSLADVASSLSSDRWADARTEAQGDLTGHLARKHPESYGGHWNRLARLSRAKLESDLAPRIRAALAAITLPERCLATVLLDINRIAMYHTYAAKFQGLPEFHADLWEVYRSGRLPCGWAGALDDWPDGGLIAF